MKEKTINTIKIVVALVLLAGISVGLFFGGRWFIGELDGIFPAEDTEQTDDTDNPPGGEQSGTDQSGGDATAQAFYVDSDGYGYRTIDGVTVFFKRIALKDRFLNDYCDICNSINCTSIQLHWIDACNCDAVSLSGLERCVVPYGSYMVRFRYSFDSLLWSEFYYKNMQMTETTWQEVYWQNISPDHEYVYVSYTFITNCANPLYVLSDLKANAFDFGTLPNGDSNVRLSCSCNGLG